MSSYWFTDSGSSGAVTLDWVDGGWHVIEPETDSLVKCVLKGERNISKSASPQKVEGTVSRYVIGMGDEANYLHLLPGDHTPKSTSNEASSRRRKSNTKKLTSDDVTALSDITGSGDYVSVEATVDTVFSVNKDKSGIPDIKGKLTDDSVLNGVVFIVESGAPSPYLEEGKTFRFNNVKDHYYKRGNEVQVKITRNTDFTEIDSH